MECEKCTNELTAYLDGELSESRAREIGNHTETCRPCAAELAALKDAAAFLDSSMQAVELQPELWQNVRARISVLEAPAPSAGLMGFIEVHRWATVTTAVIATVAITFAAWNFMRYEQSQKQLQRYMNAYIQQRESQVGNAVMTISPGETSPARNAISPVAYRPDESNPFLQVDSIPDSNPFRAEAQR